MKPLLIDVSKFGGTEIMPELQKLVDAVYEQGYKDGSRKYGSSLEVPPIKFESDGMVMAEFDWIDDEA